MNNPLWIYMPPVVLAIAAMGAPFWGFFLFLRFDVLAALCWLVRIGWEFRSDFRGFFREGGR